MLKSARLIRSPLGAQKKATARASNSASSIRFIIGKRINFSNSRSYRTSEDLPRHNPFDKGNFLTIDG